MGAFLFSLFLPLLTLCFALGFSSGSDNVKVLNLHRALQANRSLCVHSHIQGNIQTGKMKVAVLISGTGESSALGCCGEGNLSLDLKSLQFSMGTLIGFQQAGEIFVLGLMSVTKLCCKL